MSLVTNKFGVIDVRDEWDVKREATTALLIRILCWTK